MTGEGTAQPDRQVRILFSATSGHGHLQPLVPLARAAAAAGHRVLLTGAAVLAQHVAGLELPYRPTGPDLHPIRSPLVLQDLDHERRAVERHFAAGHGRERGAAVLALAREWEPDVLVVDEFDFGAMIAAELLDLPHATVVVGTAGGILVPETAAEPLQALRSFFRLPPEDGMAMVYRHLALAPGPPSFRDPAFPLPGRVVAYRDADAPARTAPSDTTVYVTLGTIFNTESGDLLQRLIAAVASCPAVGRVLAATGPHIRPEELGELPGNVTARSWVDQRVALGGCSAVVCHAGSGTVLGCIAHGLPVVCLPMGADQPLNAARCEQLGFGVSLPPDQATGPDVSAAVTAVLRDGRYRIAARQLQAEWLQLPEVDVALEAVLGLVG